ncbi:hypothetical protein M407DRAFT_18950 [Tulasnella calospora MUT 4182]|uniref:DRBM domain-containing protein n=1 Tax=Tulasnella calospora MUT 4182 TaxID=1051891 RepID=A0A0C3MEE8_9AGAM|nr:hypothetical protein M407DRAFT_18948 [Tulasnella calospora MUT 4182]KIO32139.1 hypothetical protein M407DRAFT_18950 [Tulasnella calospora MUT 4182]
MEGQRFYMTMHNMQQKQIIIYREEAHERGPRDAPEWEVWIHVSAVNTTLGYRNIANQSFWQRASKKSQAKEMVARQVLLALGLNPYEIQ